MSITFNTDHSVILLIHVSRIAFNPKNPDLMMLTNRSSVGLPHQEYDYNVLKVGGRRKYLIQI